MTWTKKTPRRLAGRTGEFREVVSGRDAGNYARLVCTCRGRGVCAACTHFAAIHLAGPGYRSYWPRAQAVALSAALGFGPTGGTVAASRECGPVLENTMNVAVATPTESGVLSCPNSGAGGAPGAAMSCGFGQGAPVRKAGGVATFTFSTPCPPDALENADGGFSVSHVGA